MYKRELHYPRQSSLFIFISACLVLVFFVDDYFNKLYNRQTDFICQKIVTPTGPKVFVIQ